MGDVQRYGGRVIDSLQQPSEDKAWDVWLQKFVDVVREFPPPTSLGWRLYPELFKDGNFESNTYGFRVVGRLVFDRDGAPLPPSRRIYDNTEMFHGFGLAQKHDG